MKENVVSLYDGQHDTDDRSDTPERLYLKRVLAAQHAKGEFRTKDPSIWEWAKAYDYVEENFGTERTEVLRQLARMDENPARPIVDRKTAHIGHKPHRHPAPARRSGPEPVSPALDMWIESLARCLPLPPANDDSEFEQ